VLRHVPAVLVALAVFAMVVCVVAAAVPYALGRVYGCEPPDRSCGDSVGWAMIILSPILVPVTLLLAAGLSFMSYFRVMRLRAHRQQGG
jgi:hypothetical protein